MKNLLVIVLSVFLGFNLNAQIKIIPMPTSLVEKEGFYVFGKSVSTHIIGNNTATYHSLLRFTNLLKEKKVIQSTYNNDKISSEGIVFQSDETLSNLGAEGYKISVSPKRILIAAYKKAGFFYAMQTLRQLFPPEFESEKGLKKPGMKIPCVEITDNPRFQWRGMLLDCGRHFMDKAFVKRYIDLLAYYKMNTLHWHLTEDQGWRIEIKKYPLLTSVGAWRTEADGSRYGGFYTQDDIREIVEYAEERFVTVVPEIEMPGHSVAAIAAYPYLSCTGNPINVETQWGVFKDIYCAGNDSTFVFLKDVLTEVMALFPSKYIHIGGDEAPKFRWEQCPKCQQRMKTENIKGEHKLQTWFIEQMDAFLAQNGRKLIGWDEILEGGLSKGATVQSWRGMEGAIEAARSGHDAIVSPTSHAYFDYDISNISLEKVYSFDPIPKELNDAEKLHILGGECNLWSERATQDRVDERMFPRILAMSEVLWNYPEKRDFNAFRKRVQLQYPVLNEMGVTYGFERDPLIMNTSADISHRTISIQLEKGQEDTQIYYTLDGSKPDRNSILYTKPLIAKDSLKINIAVLANGSENGFYYERCFKMNKATGYIPVLSMPYNKNYAAKGDGSLTDGVLGTDNFRDGNWQGFEGEDLIATIDLGTVKEFSKLSAGFLQSTASWIFFPTTAEFLVSDNGVHFISTGKVNAPESPKNVELQIRRYEISTPQPIKARYIQIAAKNMGVCPDWHPGAGGKTWIFADEIIVE